MRRWTLCLFLTIAALPFLLMWRAPAPGANRTAGPGAGGKTETLVVISPHRREVRQEYSRGFGQWIQEKEGRLVEIQWLDVGGTSKILKEIESRFSAAPDHPGLDLMFGGGVAPFLTAVDRHWLDTWDPPAGLLEGIPATCAGSPVYDPAHRWFGVTLSGFGILYNRPLLARLALPEPSTWECLATPAYFSWVGSGDPRSSGSVHMCYEIILQSYGYEKGWPIIAGLCANVRSFGEAGGTVPREVAAGEIVAGMVIDQYAQTVIQSVGDTSLAFALPKAQTVISPDAIALFKGAPHAGLAKRFMEYTLSPEGQRLLFQPAGTNGQEHALYRLPVVAALYQDPEAPHPNPYEFPGGVAYDNDKATRRWNLVNDLMGVWLIDAHAELQAAWRRACRAGASPDERLRLTAPPVGEKELEALSRKWNDPRFKQATLEQWSLAAQARYKARAQDNP